ncbi:MAG: Uma2 family endonuclease [Planctomycetes bacterium]|nr:Uma2 family endonuclease [Planctomycetota bacterium]
MRATDVLATDPGRVPVDRWLFEGDLVERWNGAGFHTPAHAAAVMNVSRLLSNWCRATSNHRAFGYGCPFVLARNPDTLVTFDASVVRRDVCEKPRWNDARIEGAPVLAVEVVELDEDPDLLTRLVEVALRTGTGSVWMIDPHEEIVVVHRRGCESQYLNGVMALDGGADLSGFRCPVAEIFE